MKKILILLLTALLLCSCSKIENEQTIYKNSTLTKLDIWFNGCDTNTVKELTDEFNSKYKNIVVNTEILDKDTLNQKLADAVKTDKLPNAIFDYSTNAYTYKEFLAPAENFWQQETLNDINTNITPYIKYNGKYFLMPVGYDLNLMAINKALVKEEYLSDEYNLQTFEKLLQNSAAPYGFYYDENLILETLNNSGSYVIFDKKLNLQNKTFLNGINSIKNYIDKGYIDKTKLAYTKEKMLSQFLDQKIALIPNFNISDYYKCKEKGIEVQITTLPAKEKTPAKVSASVCGFAIFKNDNTKEPEAAVKFAEYFAQNEKFIKSLKMIPARNSQHAFFDKSTLDKSFETENIMTPFELNDKTSKTFTLFYEYLDKIFLTDTPAKDAMDELNNLIY